MALPPLKVPITGDETGLNQALGRAQRSIKSFAMAGAAAIGVATAAMGIMTGRAMQTIDAQAKLARAIGGTTAAMQGLQRAADRAGVQQSELAAAATRLNQRLGQVIATGDGAEDTFRALGITAQQLADMDVDERFAAISDAMTAAGMSSQEMSYHLRELGIRQSSVITLLQGGGDEIRRSRQMVEAFGVAVSEVDAAAIERANDAMQEVGRVFEGLANQMAVRIAPFLERFSNSFTALALEGGPLRDALDQIVDSAGRLMTVMSDPAVIQGFASALTGIMSVAQGVAKGLAWVVENTELVTASATAAAGAIALAGGPLTLFVTAAALAVAGVMTLLARVRDTFGSVGNLMSMLRDVVAESFDRIQARVASWQAATNAATASMRGQFLGLVETIAGAVSGAVGAVVSGTEGLVNAALAGLARMVNAAIDGINLLIRGISAIPGIDLDPIGKFEAAQISIGSGTAAIDGLRDSIAGLRADADTEADGYSDAMRMLSDAADAPLASLERLRKAMQGPVQLANDPAADLEGPMTAVPGLPPGVSGDGSGASSGGGGGSSVADQFQQRLDALMEGMQTEAEALNAWYAEGQQTLTDALAQKLLTEQEYLEARTRLEEEYARRSAQIEELRQQNSFAAVSGGINDILNAAAQGNERIMQVQKAFAAGMAWIDTIQGAARMLRAGTFGFAAAAAVIAKGVGFVSAINSTSATSRGGIGGGGGAAAAAPAELPTQTVRFDFGGQNPMGGKELVDMINDAYDRGFRIRGVLA